ncbi:MAG: sugar ABC transporter ATP-binding protein [Alphaproteobacteria bacterium]|nr:sugar ABC transporter ATP-binding protein [Alphaproteobacteria bacterium]MBU1559613.1 sugar ABC transporter ATP-binding protein [Alphaproteobacteria bacterium]MBU2304388.1 sugar ABC transporter ATP-binding protein [Alphaproteobacteria bacterium]MBU2367173.1 sugar ABC transporter ATP-binding protein [Alphaproteobacteria bacterium]
MFNSSSTSALSMTNITKRFPGVTALDGVNISLSRGEVLALVGENGAGKSTLMKILAGAYRADEGEISLFGKTVSYTSPLLMMRMGVAIIYQELLLAPHLTVAENIYLGRLPRTPLGTVEWAKVRKDAAAIINRLGFDIDVNAPVETLSVAYRQIVEIAKALSQNARILVLDEPSAVLGDAELEKLFAIIRRLAAEGMSFIYISHRLEEVFAISDRTQVMRDGRVVGVKPTSELTRNELVRMMVGRELSDVYPDRKPVAGKMLLEVQGLSNSILKEADIHVREGEIVGVCGLAGAGRSELLRAIAGADSAQARVFNSMGVRSPFRSPRRGLARRVGLVPEDRRKQGLFVDQSVGFNISIAKLSNATSAGVIVGSKERQLAAKYIARLRIKTPSKEEIVGNLSGGNQQKCVLAKLLNADCRVLLIDEPTRGVDIGAKREIYQVLAELADREKVGIIMVSSELPEILGLCDRTYVMRNGRVVQELVRGAMTEERIMMAATGSDLANA